MKSGMVVKVIVWTLALAAIGGLFFWIGRRSAKAKVTKWSQLTGKYLIEQEVSCPNGKKLGMVQVDLDLTNGKLRVVRNDPGKYPSCALP